MLCNRNFYLSFTLILVLLASCKKVQQVTDVIVQPTEREIYERNFDDSDSTYLNWKSEFEIRKNDSLQITLPFVLQGQFNSKHNDVLSLKTQVKEGERLILVLENIPDSLKTFVNIYPENGSDKNTDSELFQGVLNSQRQTILENGSNDTIKIVIQPEIKLTGNYTLKIYTEPVYAFPVSGHTHKSVKSFWGAPRDGGRRSHKGVDIFAKRGTPIIAIAEGRVRKTGNYGLGGKQVWIRESIFGNSLYYAHLDSVAIADGTRVKIGDTLGFVGNTGNAKSTAPHLHFGIYKRYLGAVDPYPFIKESELLIFKHEMISASGFLRTAPANIRMGPNTKYNKLLTAQEKFKIRILGKTDDWFFIALPTDVRGFVHESLVNQDHTEPVL